MAITLADIGAVQLRILFPLYVRDQCQRLGIPIPEGWPECLSDADLVALLRAVTEIEEDPSDG